MKRKRRTYLLPPHLSGDLVVSWQRGWQRLVIRRNGRFVGMILDLKLLGQQSKVFRLSDGSLLKIENYYTGAVFYDFNLYLNDQLLQEATILANSESAHNTYKGLPKIKPSHF